MLFRSVNWKLKQTEKFSFEIFDEAGSKLSATSSSSDHGIVVITNPSIHSLILKGRTRSPLPTEYALKQNYPNPFNALTTIEFDLPVSSNVTIKLLNVLGEEVREIVHNQQFLSGSHTVRLDGNDLSSGIYFYKLVSASRSGNVQITKKLTLLK